MGIKTAARTAMRAAGVPSSRCDRAGRRLRELLALGEEIGYPLIVKAAAGGGGKGMKVVHAPEDAERALESARREGEKYFADAAVYVERYLEVRATWRSRCSRTRMAVSFTSASATARSSAGTRSSSRNPVSRGDGRVAARIGAIAVDAARAAGYARPGRSRDCSPEGEYFFMEMNTRIQVEHTVTELVTGLDLVREQVLIAAGEPLSFAQDDVVLRGHAIECRINAEDVAKGFLPAPGGSRRIVSRRAGVRVDSGVGGDEVSGLYDPMIAKLIVHDTDREAARRRMLRALAEFVVDGPPTLLGFHRALLEHPCFVAGSTCHGVVESEELAQRAQELSEALSYTTTITAGWTERPGSVRRCRGGRAAARGSSHVTEPPWAELARRRRGRAEGFTAAAVVRW